MKKLRKFLIHAQNIFVGNYEGENTEQKIYQK